MGNHTRERGMWRNRAGLDRSLGGLVIGSLVMLAIGLECRGDTVIMKNGLVFMQPGHAGQGQLARLHLGWPETGHRAGHEGREDRWRTTRSGPASGSQLVQPIVVHGGAMPQGSLERESRPLG